MNAMTARRTNEAGARRVDTWAGAAFAGRMPAPMQPEPRRSGGSCVAQGDMRHDSRRGSLARSAQFRRDLARARRLLKRRRHTPLLVPNEALDSTKAPRG